jgi:hypothetical protein
MFFVEWTIVDQHSPCIQVPCLDMFGYIYFILLRGMIYGLTLPSQDLFGCAIVIECLLKNLVSYLICSLQKKTINL